MHLLQSIYLFSLRQKPIFPFKHFDNQGIHPSLLEHKHKHLAHVHQTSAENWNLLSLRENNSLRKIVFLF